MSPGRHVQARRVVVGLGGILLGATACVAAPAGAASPVAAPPGGPALLPGATPPGLPALPPPYPVAGAPGRSAPGPVARQPAGPALPVASRGRLVGDLGAAAWSSWENVTYLPWSRKSRYARQDGPDGPVVRVDADDSASMLVRLVAFDPRREPIVSWRWRIASPPTAGDERVKERDDCAARVYFVWGLRSRSDVFSSKGLAYVWGRTRRVGEVGASPFTDQVGVVTLRSGAAGAGAWQVEQRDLEADYRAYFGTSPDGPVSAIALLTDTDHTNGRATAWYGPVHAQARPAR
ncbi:MAG: DUF3047 domain-containing protein [Candidatus Sericytochromatia bacterium]|nr:DUF3047 domain-containing protein [Candidatus Sericytochromatia bacterium]